MTVLVLLAYFYRQLLSSTSRKGQRLRITYAAAAAGALSLRAGAGRRTVAGARRTTAATHDVRFNDLESVVELRGVSS